MKRNSVKFGLLSSQAGMEFPIRLRGNWEKCNLYFIPGSRAAPYASARIRAIAASLYSNRLRLTSEGDIGYFRPQNKNRN